MRFLTALKSGASVKNVSEEFFHAIFEKSRQDKELNLELACDFVNDILLAVGLECAITPEQINNNWSYVWPMEQIQIYNFHYVESDFQKLEEFLVELCTIVKLQNELFMNELNEEGDEHESPYEYLMELIAVWCSAFKQLMILEKSQTIKHFEEPFARINIHLLLGMHDLRKIYHLDSHISDAICVRLYWSALDGLYYRQTHDMIFSGLLDIFSKNYDLFYKSSTKTINFFYESFIVESLICCEFILQQSLQKRINGMIKSLRRILTEYNKKH